jgi:hypothetical protein
MNFDALDAMQSMLERATQGWRDWSEGGAVAGGRRCVGGQTAGRWSNDLLSSVSSRSSTPLGLTVLDGRTQVLAARGVLEQLVKNPVAYCIECNDGQTSRAARTRDAGTSPSRDLRPTPK